MNGNDLIEFEQEHFEELADKFTDKYSDMFDEFRVSLVSEFIEAYPDLWNKFLMDEYVNHQADSEDYYNGDR